MRLTESQLRQAIAFLAQQPLVRKGSLVSPSATIEAWKKQDNITQIGTVMRLFNTSQRGDLFSGKQTEIPWNRFSGLVPLALSAFKEINLVGYAQWDWRDEGMGNFLDEEFKRLIPFITGAVDDPFTFDELVQLRYDLGSSKSLKQVWQITDSQVPTLKGYPRLFKVIKLQTWVAMSEFRHPLMLLDLHNLDSMPEPMDGSIEGIFKGEDDFTFLGTKPKVKISEDSIWNA